MAVLKQNENQLALFNGWYGTCDECDPFLLTDASNRGLIYKVGQITNDNKSYTRFDATVNPEFDNINGFQDFTELECGKAYIITLKSGTGELPVNGFTESNISDPGVGKIIEMEGCTFNEELPTPTPASAGTAASTNSPICLTGSTTYTNGTWLLQGNKHGHPFWRSQTFTSHPTFKVWYLYAKTAATIPQWRISDSLEAGGTFTDSSATTSSPELSGWGSGVVINVGVCGSEPVNCEGHWSEYNECDSECGGGLQTSSYVVTKDEQNGGTCENRDKIRTQSCNTEPCKIDRNDGKLFLKTYPDAYYPSAEFFGCAVNTYAGILRPGLKTKYARKYGHGAIGDADGRHYSCQMYARQMDFKGNILALGNFRAMNSTGATMLWKLGTYKQSDCIGNEVYKTSGATNNLIQGMCDPINKSVRGDSSSWMESSKMLTLNRTGSVVYIGAPAIPRMDGSAAALDTVGGFKTVPINTRNGITSQNSISLRYHRFGTTSQYYSSSLNIDGIATDFKGNVAISQPARSKLKNGSSHGALLINNKLLVWSPTQDNGTFGRTGGGGRTLVGGYGFFAVSNYSLNRVYIISSLGGSWRRQAQLTIPSNQSVKNYGYSLSATPVIKNQQYLCVEARTNSNKSVIYTYSVVTPSGNPTLVSIINLNYAVSSGGFCVNSRTHPVYGASVDVYISNRFRKYKKEGEPVTSTGSIDCYDGLTGELRTYTEVPSYGEVKVADTDKSYVDIGTMLVCNGNYVAAKSDSLVRQNHKGSSAGQVTVGGDIILVYDIKND
jgi:hypothetical protein